MGLQSQIQFRLRWEKKILNTSYIYARKVIKSLMSMKVNEFFNTDILVIVKFKFVYYYYII